MKNKGFTLIELLAVIVILAIIALIATPIILNVINNARKSAAIDSAYGYIESIEKQNALAQLDPEKYTAIESGDVATLTVNVKGKKPTSGSVTISNGKVTSATLTISGFEITYDGKEASIGGSSNSENSLNEQEEPATSIYTPGQTVKYNPVANAKCTTGTTCYTWRVITVGDTITNDKITLQLDHNLGNTVAWVSREDYNDDTNYGTNKGPITTLETLEEATSGWNNSLKLTYSYNTSAATNNYGTLSCTNGACTVAGSTITSNLKARMITGEEIKALTMNTGAASGTKADSWTLSTSQYNGYYFSKTDKILGTVNNVSDGETGNTNLSWLIENTQGYSSSGATEATNNGYSANSGYWTLSPISDNSQLVWVITRSGEIEKYEVYNSSFFGVRPVITIPKSILS